MNQSVLENLANMIRNQRGNQSQAAFAERLGVTQSQVSKWEQGANFPQLSQIEALAEDRGILPEELIAEIYGRKIHGTIVNPVDPLQELLKRSDEERLQALVELAKSLEKR